MLCHPAFLPALVGGNTQRKAFFAQQDIAAIAAVAGTDIVIFRKLQNIAFFCIYIAFSVLAADKIAILAQGLDNLFPNAGHDYHVEHHINAIGYFNANFGERGAYHTHRIWDNIHGAALHSAAHNFVGHGITLGRRHLVIGSASVTLFPATNKGSVLNPGHIIDSGTVIIAVWQQILIQLNHFSRAASYTAQFLNLFLAAVNPDDIIRLEQVGRFFDKLVDLSVFALHAPSSIFYTQLPFQMPLLLLYVAGSFCGHHPKEKQ